MGYFFSATVYGHFFHYSEGVTDFSGHPSCFSNLQASITCRGFITVWLTTFFSLSLIVVAVCIYIRKKWIVVSVSTIYLRTWSPVVIRKPELRGYKKLFFFPSYLLPVVEQKHPTKSSCFGSNRFLNSVLWVINYLLSLNLKQRENRRVKIRFIKPQQAHFSKIDRKGWKLKKKKLENSEENTFHLYYSCKNYL